METAYRRCGGIDVHKKSITVHVLPPVGQPYGKHLERQFRTFTRDLKRLYAQLTFDKITNYSMLRI